MAGFLYYLPNVRTLGSTPGELRAILASFGLLHIMDRADKLHHRQVIDKTPSGTPGLIVGNACNWDAEQVKQSPEVKWKPFPKPHAEKQAWCGVLGELPTPEDLKRKAQLPGEWLEMADGHRWLIPIARDCEGKCSLPVSFDIDEETGGWVPTQVQREYQAIWNHAEQYMSAMLAALEQVGPDGTATWTIPEFESLVIDSLQVNYRVSAIEAAWLGVLVSGIAGDIANILIDMNGYEAIKKKEVLDSGSGSTGTPLDV